MSDTGMDEATLAGIDEVLMLAQCEIEGIPYTAPEVIVARSRQLLPIATDLVAEVRRLSAELAEQQRENERLRAPEYVASAAATLAATTPYTLGEATAAILQVGRMQQRAEAAEAALADLRAKVEALPRRMLNTIDPAGDGYTVRIDCVNAVRALAAAPSGEPNQSPKETDHA